MPRLCLLAATIFLLTACAPTAHVYETPEARQQMRRDLNLDTLIDSSRMNWCVHPYGSAPGCVPEKGVGIVTPDALVMAYVVNEKYVLARILKSDDIICSTVPGGASADGIFFAFAAREAYMLGALQADRDETNTRFKAHMFDYLHSKGQHSFSGPAVNFQRPTGVKIQQTVVVPAGPLTRVSTESIDELEVYSPCAEHQQPPE